MSSLNIVFAGTPDFAARHLDALINSEHRLCGVYTQPDRPSGRGKKVSMSPVKALALAHDLPVFQPLSLKGEPEQAELAEQKCDLMVVVAYGLLLPKTVLSIPRYGCINVHGSILPKWRGAAPIQRAVEAGDATTGVTIMQMDEGLDTGDMLHTATCAILPTDTSGDIYQRLSDIGPSALLDAIDDIAHDRSVARKQIDSQSSYARKIDKIEAQIDWHQSAQTLDQKIRAFNPAPICFTTLAEERLRIHLARPSPISMSQMPPGGLKVSGDKIFVACGDGVLEILKLQLPGKKAMDAADFLNGFRALVEGEGNPIILGNS